MNLKKLVRVSNKTAKEMDADSSWHEAYEIACQYCSDEEAEEVATDLRGPKETWQ